MNFKTWTLNDVLLALILIVLLIALFMGWDLEVS